MEVSKCPYPQPTPEILANAKLSRQDRLGLAIYIPIWLLMLMLGMLVLLNPDYIWIIRSMGAIGMLVAIVQFVSLISVLLQHRHDPQVITKPHIDPYDLALEQPGPPPYRKPSAPPRRPDPAEEQFTGC